MTYSQSFVFGFVLTIGASLVTGFTFYLFLKYIDPTYLGEILEQMEKALYESGTPDSEIDKIMALYRSTLTPGMFAVGMVFLFGMLGTVVALIASAILKNPKSIFED